VARRPTAGEIRRAITSLDGTFGPSGGPQAVRIALARLQAWLRLGARGEHGTPRNPGISWP